MAPALWAVVPAAGGGTRMRADRPKQYLSLLGRPIVFFAPDHAAYERERGFYFDYRTGLPGPIFETTAEVGAYIRRFCEDASSQTCKDGDQTCAESQADEGLDISGEHVESCDCEERQCHDKKPRDRTRAERELKRLCHAALGRFGGLFV